MKKNLLKILLICALPYVTLTGKAQAETHSAEKMSIEEYVKVLNSVDGFIFVGVGEERDITRTLGREPGNEMDQDDVKDLYWMSLNNEIVSVDKDADGMITGNSYGETIIQGIGEDFTLSYVVFVCPKVTVCSPEGGIYSYHKIFNQATRVQFTHSKDYVLNCVTRNGVDITNPENLKDGETFDEKTGWYESPDPITEDVEFHVTMEKRNDNDNMVNTDSDINILVDNNNIVTIDNPTAVAGKTITVTDFWDNVLESNLDATTGVLTFKYPEGGKNYVKKGVFFIEIEGDNTYKILIK